MGVPVPGQARAARGLAGLTINRLACGMGSALLLASNQASALDVVRGNEGSTLAPTDALEISTAPSPLNMDPTHVLPWHQSQVTPPVRFDLSPGIRPERLSCGDRIEGLAGRAGDVHLFVWRVRPNTRRIRIRMEGGDGDADLYVRHAAEPTPSLFDARPFVRGNDEVVIKDDPPAGDWYILIHGYTAFENVQLSVICRVHEPEEKQLPPGTARDLELALYYEFGDDSTATDRELIPELRYRTLRLEGRMAFNAGDYDRAITIWQEWADLEPRNPEPVALIGDTYLRRQLLVEAVEQYQESLAIQPGQIRLITRLARLLDLELNQYAEARDLLNYYERLFPEHPELVLAKAEWLIRRRRYGEAETLINLVLTRQADNLRALTLRHTLLETPEERFANLRRILDIGARTRADPMLARVILDHHLLTRPESWLLLTYIDDIAFSAPEEHVREAFQALLPRTEVAVEDFRIGRLSRNWTSSRDQLWGDDGTLQLGADPTQTEAYLRLEQSDAMPSGFIEADIEGTRGYCWLYARRGEGNMVRFGFDDAGRLYQQVWVNGQLHLNEMRLWARDHDSARLRLEIRADGIFALINGRRAFPSPLAIPRDMGLGWWGVAPWAPEPGIAAVNIRRVAGGPLPPRLLWVDYADRSEATARSPEALNQLRRMVEGAMAVWPDWYEEDSAGHWQRRPHTDDAELRLLARHHRARLMPLVRLHADKPFDWDEAERIAARDRLDGFTVMVYKMPGPAWMAAAETESVRRELALNLILIEAQGNQAILREIAPHVGLLPGPRRDRSLPITPTAMIDPDVELDTLGPQILRMQGF